MTYKFFATFFLALCLSTQRVETNQSGGSSTGGGGLCSADIEPSEFSKN